MLLQGRGPTFVQPGSGFSGATAQPANVGASSRETIARFNVVPYQTFSGLFRVGVVAFHSGVPHTDGIDYVAFSVNGGAWVSASERTYNVQSGTKEHFVYLDAADFADGQIEIRAIAYPVVGKPRVIGPASPTGSPDMSSLYLNANSGGTLPATTLYVATTGNDTTGDGSQGNPYLTIVKAKEVLRIAGTAGGGTIYCAAGTYAYNAAQQNFDAAAVTQWMTVSAAPGVARSDVIINSQAHSSGLRTQKIRLRNLTVSGIVLSSTSSIGAAIWFDNVRYIGAGHTVAGSRPTAGGTVFTAGCYSTDCEISDCEDGAVDCEIVRNTICHDLGSDAFRNTILNVNLTAYDIGLDTGITGFHPDVYQMVSGTAQNRILYGVTATSGINAQGFFTDGSTALVDVALVDSIINNSDATDPLLVMQLGNVTTNLYGWNSSLLGSAAQFRTDLAFSGTDVIFDTMTWEAANPTPNPQAGVTHR